MTESFQAALRNYLKISDSIENEEGEVIGVGEIAGSEKLAKFKSFLKLKQSLNNLEFASPFSISGNVILNASDVKCVLEVKVTNDEFHNLGKIDQPDIATLVEYKDNLLGKNEQVKLSYERADCKVVANVGKMHWISAVEDVVKEKLFNGTFDVSLCLESLTVHCRDGNFERSAGTTPHESFDVLGTVLVCLPTAHVGGSIVISQGSQSCAFDLAAQSEFSDTLQFVAFYPSCDYVVQPVIGGNLALLNFTILKSTAVEPPLENVFSVSEDIGFPAIVTKVSGVLYPEVVIPSLLDLVFEELEASLLKHGHIGLFLSHSYVDEGLDALHLQGIDKLLYDCLNQHKIPLSLLHVLCDHEEHERSSGSADGHCAVRLVADYADTRLPVHQSVSSNLAFLFAWQKTQRRTVGEHKWLCGALVAGPLPSTLVHRKLLATEMAEEARDTC